MTPGTFSSGKRIRRPTTRLPATRRSRLSPSAGSHVFGASGARRAARRRRVRLDARKALAGTVSARAPSVDGEGDFGIDRLLELGALMSSVRPGHRHRNLRPS